MTAPPVPPPEVAAVFSAMSETERAGLMALRQMIFAVAERLPSVGRIEEALRWRQPAYLTPETKSGSTLRLGVVRSGGFGLFAHCQTSIIPEFRAIVGTAARFDGNRAVLFQKVDELAALPLNGLIRHALTYHQKH